MKYWVAKDKDGTIHFSNIKPIKPSEYYKENPNANNKCFWIFTRKSDAFFLPWNDDIPGLTFENSPKEINIVLK